MVRSLSCLWRIWRVAFALVVLTALAWPAHAQVVGQIQGTVTDAQGGVLPGVSMTFRNTETGVVRTTVSESDGQYRFAGLQPGTYALKAELQGFATVNVERLTITIGLQLQQDLKMQLQSLQETVTVTGEAPVIEVTRNRSRAGDYAGADRNAANGGSPAGQPRAAAPRHQHGQHAGAPLAGEHRRRRHQQSDERVLPRWFIQLVDQLRPAARGNAAAGDPGVPRQRRPGVRRAWRQRRRSGEHRHEEWHEPVQRRGARVPQEPEPAGARQERGGRRRAEADYKRYQWGFAFGGPVIKDKMHFFGAIEYQTENKSFTVNSGLPQFYSTSTASSRPTTCATRTFSAAIGRSPSRRACSCDTATTGSTSTAKAAAAPTPPLTRATSSRRATRTSPDILGHQQSGPERIPRPVSGGPAQHDRTSGNVAVGSSGRIPGGALRRLLAGLQLPEHALGLEHRQPELHQALRAEGGLLVLRGQPPVEVRRRGRALHLARGRSQTWARGRSPPISSSTARRRRLPRCATRRPSPRRSRTWCAS